MVSHIDVTRKRPSRWPWLLGLAVLALLLWGVTVLLTPDPPEPEPVPEPLPADTLVPSAIPGAAREPGAAAAPGLDDVAPLDEDDAGQTVQVRGEVVATGNGGFWVVEGRRVLRIDSDRVVRRGDTLTVMGTLQAVGSEAVHEPAAEVLDRHPAGDRWTLVQALELVADDPPPPADSSGAAANDEDDSGTGDPG